MCPEGLLSEGGSLTGSSCIHPGHEQGGFFGKETVLDRELLLTESRRDLRKCREGSAECHQPVSLGVAVTSRVLLGTPSFCSLPSWMEAAREPWLCAAAPLPSGSLLSPPCIKHLPEPRSPLLVALSRELQGDIKIPV